MRLEIADPRYRHLSLRGPVTLFIVVLVLIVVLTVLWNVVLVNDYQKLRQLATESAAFHWTYIGLGTALFVTIITLSSILGARLIGQIRWNRHQTNLLASVSHELNSPLSSIKLFAQTLERVDLEPEARADFVGKILDDVERLQRLIANILRAAEADHLEGSELRMAPRTVDLRAYLEAYLRDANLLRDPGTVELSLEAPTMATVRLDAQMFRQVLDNLVDNAIRYAGELPARIALSVAHEDGWVRLAVADGGIGVPLKALPHLFDRFFRVGERGQRDGRRGTGIGLYVVRTIVQAHAGKVSASSDGLGHGTTITVRLPAVPEPAR